MSGETRPERRRKYRALDRAARKWRTAIFKPLREVEEAVERALDAGATTEDLYDILTDYDAVANEPEGGDNDA